MDKTPASIRRQSILNIPKMGLSQKRNIQDRIFKNDDISAAKARQTLRVADRESIKN